MFLKNYTSEQPVHQTLAKIEKTLVECGVSQINKEYDGFGKVVAVMFQIILPGAPPWAVRLPAKVQQAWDALWAEYVGKDKVTGDGMRVESWSNPHKRKHKATFREQAERTAWRLMQDWVEVQMSMVKLQQADFREVFLPFVLIGDKTYYQHLQATGFKALLPETLGQSFERAAED